jgi:hypothetical protein
MKGKQVTVLISLAIYVFTVGGLTIYHAFNFTDYIHRKGDETIDYTYFLLFTSILFQGAIWVITKVFDWKAVVFATIANFILSYIVGLGVLMVSGLSGIPRHLIFTYGGCYLTFLSIVTVAQSGRLRAKT